MESQEKYVKNPSTFLYAVLTYMLFQNKDSILPEIFYIFDCKDVFKFLKLFGGKRVYIPTPEELHVSMREILYDYLKTIEGCNTEEAKKIVDFHGYKTRYTEPRLEEWKKFLTENGYLTLEDLAKFDSSKIKMDDK